MNRLFALLLPSLVETLIMVGISFILSCVLGLLLGMLTGTGFSFSDYNGEDMLHVINYAKQVFFEQKRYWNQMAERGMRSDFSWKVSAEKYKELYNYLIGA